VRAVETGSNATHQSDERKNIHRAQVLKLLSWQARDAAGTARPFRPLYERRPFPYQRVIGRTANSPEDTSCTPVSSSPDTGLQAPDARPSSGASRYRELAAVLVPLLGYFFCMFTVCTTVAALLIGLFSYSALEKGRPHYTRPTIVSDGYG
jgi:hypothetical protein